jgi:hypothetical protein
MGSWELSRVRVLSSRRKGQTTGEAIQVFVDNLVEVLAKLLGIPPKNDSSTLVSTELLVSCSRSPFLCTVFLFFPNFPLFQVGVSELE